MQGRDRLPTCGCGVDVIRASRLGRGRRIGVWQVGLHVEDGRAVDEVASTQVQHVALHAIELQGSWWQGWAAR